MKIFKICGDYLKKHKGKIIIFACYGIIVQLLSFVTPYITGNFIDNLITSTTMEFVYRFCIILASVTITRLLFLYLQSISYCKLQAKMGYEFNRDVIFHIQDLPISFMNNKDIAQLNSQINDDTNQLVIFCLNIFNTFILHAMALPILFAICFILNMEITMAYLAYCVIYVVVYNAIKKRRYKITRRLYESQNKFFSKLFEQMKYIAYIKSNGISGFFRKRLQTPFDNLYDSSISNQRFEYVLVTVDQVLSLIAEITLYIVGAYQIIKGNFTVGNFIIFSSYFTMVRQSIQYFYNFGSIYQQTMVSHDRTMKILTEQPESKEGEEVEKVKSVQFNDLKFSYRDDAPIFSGFKEKVTAGNIYGIVGENGSGKTTLAKIILGMYNDNIDDKTIIFNSNLDLKAINRQILRHDRIAYVEQSPILIEGEPLSNILVDKEPTEDILAYIKELAKNLNVEHVIFERSGSNQDINSLSGGERQKIAIIRALCKGADILIFDEPTAALDVASSKILMDYLTSIKMDKIILIISHDDIVKGSCDALISCEHWNNGKSAPIAP